MNNEHNRPGENQPDKWNKEGEIGTTTPGANSADNKGLETNGPNKNKPFNVLNQDGSLADLPDGRAEGSGSLEGTVGLGT